MVIPPGHFVSELVTDHWPSQNIAVGIGVSGGFFAESHSELQNGHYEKDQSFNGDSAGGTLAAVVMLLFGTCGAGVEWACAPQRR